MNGPASSDIPVRRKRGAGLFGFCLLLSGGVLLLGIFLSEPQPYYQGKSASRWFSRFASASPNEAARRSEAKEAFARMGTNPLPFLLGKLAQHRGDDWLDALAGAVGKRGLDIAPVQRRTSAAILLKEIGTNAVPALGSMLDILRQPKQLYVVDVFIEDAIATIIGFPPCGDCTRAELQRYRQRLLDRAEAIRSGKK